MENLKQKLEQTLEEHQRESGLHMIGGRERLVERLLKVLDPSVDGGNADHFASDEDGRCCQ